MVAFVSGLVSGACVLFLVLMYLAHQNDARVQVESHHEIAHARTHVVCDLDVREQTSLRDLLTVITTKSARLVQESSKVPDDVLPMGEYELVIHSNYKIRRKVEKQPHS